MQIGWDILFHHIWSKFGWVYDIKYINRAIFANLQCRPLKLGRLIALQKTHLQLWNIVFPWQPTLFQSPPATHLISICKWFSARKTLNKATNASERIYILVGSCTCGTICKYENRTPKVARNAFNIGEVWNPVCCHGNKTVELKLWITFSRILLQRIKHFWYKLAEISFFIMFDQNLVECTTSSLG